MPLLLALHLLACVVSSTYKERCALDLSGILPCIRLRTTVFVICRSILSLVLVTCLSGKGDLALAAVGRNDEKVAILHRLGRRRRGHDPRVSAVAEEHAEAVHELEASDVQAQTAARAAAPGHEGVLHLARGREPAVRVEDEGVWEDGRVAVEGVGLGADDSAGREVVVREPDTGGADGDGARDGARQALRDGRVEAQGLVDDVVEVGQRF